MAVGWIAFPARYAASRHLLQRRAALLSIAADRRSRSGFVVDEEKPLALALARYAADDRARHW